ncbi:CENP-B N-terminal DNA-binding domain [Popillia japonica]|uniref:CENP-B N-terminal DNA-binding domain n=1 Tax=Popillia japonica TaxID=7064 RepID=A0AAW1MNJ4_POPJA
MLRTYVKQLGGRPYLDYEKENMEKAIEAVKKDMSKFRASQKFKIPRTTLIDNIRETHPLKPGRPCVLTADDEQYQNMSITTTGLTSPMILEQEKCWCPEEQRESSESRTSVSVMVCGTAKGVLLPFMVTYKAQHLYEY